MKPSPGVVMVVERDVGNKYDHLTLTVKLPTGKMVGRVPASMCKIFPTLLNKRNISAISCVAAGTSTLGKYVEPQQSLKRHTKSGMDREGGGAVITCKYILKYYNSC